MRITLLLTASAGLIAAVFAVSQRLEWQLLRADPDLIPAQARLMSFARGRGELLFGAHCAQCHGAGGAADPARGIPSLSDSDWLYGSGSIGEIEQIIKYGIRSNHPKSFNLAIMPAYASARPSARDSHIAPLAPGQIGDLVEFLVREQGGAADAESSARGARLFAGGAGCYDCHAADARGDPAIGAPNLTDGITLYGDGSRAALRRSIERGRHGICPAWSARLGAGQIRELAVFVHALSHGPTAPPRAVPVSGV